LQLEEDAIPASMDNGISRRATLKGMAVLAGTATAVSVEPMLVSAANASGVFSDPVIAKSALNNPGWVSAYKDLMAECVPDSTARFWMGSSISMC